MTQPAQTANIATAAMHEDSDDEDNDSGHQKEGRCHAMWQQIWSCFLILRMTGAEHIPFHAASPFHGVTASLLSVFLKTDE